MALPENMTSIFFNLFLLIPPVFSMSAAAQGRMEAQDTERGDVL